MKKRKIISLKSARSIIKSARRNMAVYKGGNACRFALSHVVKEYYYGGYNTKYLYPRLKPYILGNTAIDNLKDEDFIEGVLEIKIEAEMHLQSATQHEQSHIDEVFNGDREFYEKTVFG